MWHNWPVIVGVGTMENGTPRIHLSIPCSYLAYLQAGFNRRRWAYLLDRRSRPDHQAKHPGSSWAWCPSVLFNSANDHRSLSTVFRLLRQLQGISRIDTVSPPVHVSLLVVTRARVEILEDLIWIPASGLPTLYALQMRLSTPYSSWLWQKSVPS